MSRPGLRLFHGFSLMEPECLSDYLGRIGQEYFEGEALPFSAYQPEVICNQSDASLGERTNTADDGIQERRLDSHLICQHRDGQAVPLHQMGEVGSELWTGLAAAHPATLAFYLHHGESGLQVNLLSSQLDRAWYTTAGVTHG